MYCFIMEPWKTIRCDKTLTTVTQTESCWLDLTPYQDIIAWLEVKQVSAGGGTNVQMAYQTSPTKDDSLFQAVTAAFNMATGVTTTIMLKDSATVTLCRYLRWQLSVTGSPSSSWDTTFRVFIAANVVGRGGRPKTVPTSPCSCKPGKATQSPVLPAPLAGSGSAAPTPPLHLASPGGTSGAQPFAPGSSLAGVAQATRQRVDTMTRGSTQQSTGSNIFSAPSATHGSG